jgi:hypothetical protein
MDNNTREALADYAHEAWSGWMNYLLSKSTVNDDGTWTVPAWAAERWHRQMSTPYHLLSEEERDNDRAEADKMLEIVGSDRAARVLAVLDTLPHDAVLRYNAQSHRWVLHTDAGRQTGQGAAEAIVGEG